MGNEKKQTKEKSLEKMTATELRDIAKELPDITGAHGMKKVELLTAIKKAKGIEDTTSKKGPGASVRDIKLKIKELKKQREEFNAQNNKKMVGIFKRRINRLKKQTRKAG
ncbi:MAG: transcription termination factor Rho [Desulfobacteraceae bacterium]|nr:Rho termination factor N-terminal domain-containing protein [Desulfobacteraceae bacterium]MBC2756774.1 transcription termination factor Rho [Desulfobacteraceae bacterium]